MNTIQIESLAPSTQEYSSSSETINKPINLNHEEIVSLLPLFKEECVYMQEACLENSVLHCLFNTFDYPFSKQPIKHFTRTHALIFVTQASYLMATLLCEQNQRWPLDRELAIKFALEEQMTFTNIELNFRHFIKNSDGIELKLSFPKFRIIKNRLFVNVEYNFPKGCDGNCQGIVAIDGSLKTQF